jgi:hypothetical protein
MNNNNGLYFLTGGLLVAVLVLGGYFFLNPDEGSEVVRESNTVIEKTVDSDNSNDEPDSSFELNVDDEGFNASSESNNN